MKNEEKGYAEKVEAAAQKAEAASKKAVKGFKKGKIKGKINR